MNRAFVFSAFWVAALVGAEARSDEAAQIEQLVKTMQKDVEQRTTEIDEGLQKLQNDLDNPDPAVRSRAIQSILATRDARLIPVITVMLQDPSASTRRKAILALYQFKAEGVADKVGALVSDSDPDVQHTAAEYGAHLGYKSSLDEVKRFLARNDFTSQSAAMHLARTLPEEQAVPLMATFLHHESHHLRKRAVSNLVKYDGKPLRPYVADILKLAGDSDHWVRGAVGWAEPTLQSLVTIDELRQLTDHASPQVQALAYRMLDSKGAGISERMVFLLSAAQPELRAAALDSFMSAGKGPEKEIVALLDDPDRSVRTRALYAVRRLKFRSAVPKLREILAEEEGSDRRYAAQALMDMNESAWAPTDPPTTRGPLYQAVEKLAGGDESRRTELMELTDELVERISKTEGFPCDQSNLLSASGTEQLPVVKHGTGRMENSLCLGARGPVDVREGVMVHHGNVVVNGVILGGIVIVTGDLFLHDGYIRDSIVLVQGKIICNGYINNSIVVAGSDQPLTLLEGYIRGSVAMAKEIDCNGYLMDSLFDGNMKTRFSSELDLRNSSQFDSKPVYKYLQGESSERSE
jgi:HEAT repeat protein